MTSQHFYAPGLGGPVSSASFTVTPSDGACTGGWLAMSGTVSGYCGAMTGAGTINGEAFGFVVAGAQVVMYPAATVTTAPPDVTVDSNVVGTGTMVHNAFTGDGCVVGANDFVLLLGALV